MAITIITQPDPGASTDNVDYTNQNLLINGAITLPNANILTDWSSTGSAPDIALGAYIRHAGNLYQVDTADEAVTGTPSAGINYLKLSVSGSTLTAAWVTSLSGYLYNEAYNGWYSGTDQILFNGDYLDGSLHRRFISPSGTYGVYLIADGKLYIDNHDILTDGGDIDTGGGGIDSNGGIIQSGGALIYSDGGGIRSEGGTIDSDGGIIQSGGGLISTEGGDLDTAGGQTTTSAIDLKAVNNSSLVSTIKTYVFNDQTEATIYTALFGYVPVVNDRIGVIGQYDNGSAIYDAAVIERINTSDVLINDNDGNQLIRAVSGDPTVVSGSLKLILITN